MIHILDAPSVASCVKMLLAPTPLQRRHPGGDRHSPHATAREKELRS